MHIKPTSSDSIDQCSIHRGGFRFRLPITRRSNNRFQRRVATCDGEPDCGPSHALLCTAAGFIIPDKRKKRNVAQRRLQSPVTLRHRLDKFSVCKAHTHVIHVKYRTACRKKRCTHDRYNSPNCFAFPEYYSKSLATP